MIETARSLLFVPGNRPERFAKAAASGADVVVLDLEDAVGPAAKVDAREHVRAWLDEGNKAVVRINGTGTPWYQEDLAMVTGRAQAVMVPKAENAEQVDLALPVIPLLETALGIAKAIEVCAADSVVRPAFGSVDLAAQLGVDHQSHDALRYARSAVVLAAAAAGCAAPIDGVTTTLADEAMLQKDLAHAIELGFTAKLCVHPRQVGPVREAFRPSAEDIDWARGVLAMAADGSVNVYNGQMVDRPVLLRAEAILARS
ncbi:HpcH/HpaI aldolase/citrate lyase family protein [Amycolatopsis jejuensis]|uniref:HpcH/HpaI aldolase/citrate lyase family protein n=1 Tax=Amycolatopsis jejuensis TaxID=330084 RepID=UPI00052739C3|nr:CoA ester lyase [Amycolatopsis jejuensis]